MGKKSSAGKQSADSDTQLLTPSPNKPTQTFTAATNGATHSIPSTKSLNGHSTPLKSHWTSPSTGLLTGFIGGSEYVFITAILSLICILAFFCRLFSVVRYESVIHEFDPWFNYRTTRYLVQEGIYEFHNWFDDMTWYPLGRFIGGTLYPGLMWTAAAVYHALHALHLTVDIRNVCVLLAPAMAAATTLATYGLTTECWNHSAGLMAAAFISVVPGYISRSVAGSYDNEAVAIFALVFSFYTWVKAVKTGSLLWAAISAIAYFYMVSTWGGYIFITNLIPAHVLVAMICGRYSHRLYVAYCTWYILGLLMSMNILFVSFQPVSSPEHLSSVGVFGILQIYNMYYGAQSHLSPSSMKKLLRLFGLGVVGVLALVVFLSITGQVPFLTGRLYSLLGATSNLAIVKSVSEHQPSPWTTFFFDLHCLVFLVPVGIYLCFKHLTDANLFIVIYVLFASYFSSIMVRLVLVLAPGMCVLAGIGASQLMSAYFDVLTSPPADKLIEQAKLASSTASSMLEVNGTSQTPADATTSADVSVLQSTLGSRHVRVPRVSKPVASLVIASVLVLSTFYTIHCNWVTSTAYSSPSIVLQAQGGDGSRIIFDDFREAYNWLNHNTAPDSKVLSWWDYGYQITGMGNRTVIVDNNTRNNTHIATVGLVMSSTEERAYPVLQALDVQYMLVVFGGKIGYSSDDINKFLWMVRISGGVYPEVVESDYFNSYGQYRIDNTASQRMRQSLMYKMCYYRFGELMTVYGRPTGFDRVRGSEVGEKNIQLTHIEEVFTSEHWMVRIYRVKTEKDDPNFELKAEHHASK